MAEMEPLSAGVTGLTVALNTIQMLTEKGILSEADGVTILQRTLANFDQSVRDQARTAIKTLMTNAPI